MGYDPKTAGEAKLTSGEVQYLQSMLDAHNRGGFYAAYASMSGSHESLLRAAISTFSENVGGIAAAANKLSQLWAHNYPGVYVLSQEIAQSALTAITADLNNGGNGPDCGGGIERRSLG